jgi:hypothetical protein
MNHPKTPTPPTQVDDNPQNYWQSTTDASTDATDTSATDAGGPLLIRADGGAPTNHTQENHPMTYPEDPPRWPMRPLRTVTVVRWRYPHWQRSADGYLRWSSRWYPSISAAHRLAATLRASGAIVHHDLYRLDMVMRVDDNAGTVHGPDDLEAGAS